VRFLPGARAEPKHFGKMGKTTTFVGFSSAAIRLIFKSPEFQPYLPRRSQVLEVHGSIDRAADFFCDFSPLPGSLSVSNPTAPFPILARPA
jgi:hypothetical protein